MEVTCTDSGCHKQTLRREREDRGRYREMCLPSCTSFGSTRWDALAILVRCTGHFAIWDRERGGVGWDSLQVRNGRQGLDGKLCHIQDSVPRWLGTASGILIGGNQEERGSPVLFIPVQGQKAIHGWKHNNFPLDGLIWLNHQGNQLTVASAHMVRRMLLFSWFWLVWMCGKILFIPWIDAKEGQFLKKLYIHCDVRKSCLYSLFTLFLIWMILKTAFSYSNNDLKKQNIHTLGSPSCLGSNCGVIQP